ncbi:MAG: GNAT family N-acetyltransferase [Candidatus Hodarchaeales archaeon]|jgi:N-acetylglutamate synthase-like GNAT family acetyltransferase
MLNFVITDLERHRSILVDLNEEFFTWVYTQIQIKYNIEVLPTADTSFREFANVIVEEFAFFTPPEGISYLLYIDEEVVGMGALRYINKDTGEIKRMYVRPLFRGKGLGKKLLQQLLKKGKELGFSKIYLNTAPFMRSALHLYHSLEFSEIDEYPGSEILDKMKPFWVFMEREI